MSRISQETVEVINQLLEWHRFQVDDMRTLTENMPNKLVVQSDSGKEVVINDEQFIKGVKWGVAYALSRIGKLPIEINAEELPADSPELH